MLGIGLAAVPDVTVSKVAAAFVLTKSAYGAGANGANLVAALLDRNPVSKTGGLISDAACKLSNNNKTVKGLATAVDLATDLAMGRVAGYAAKKALGSLETLTLERVFVRNPANLGTQVDIVQGSDVAKTWAEYANEK